MGNKYSDKSKKPKVQNTKPGTKNNFQRNYKSGKKL